MLYESFAVFDPFETFGERKDRSSKGRALRAPAAPQLSACQLPVALSSSAKTSDRAAERVPELIDSG
jgi:hypothetical protein